MDSLEQRLAYFVPYLPLLGWISITMFIISLALVPLLLARIPASYFQGPMHSGNAANKFPNIHYSLKWVLRNLIALLLVFAGLLMLILPGQGILTIVLGVFIADFPGKHSLERVLISRPAIFRAINWIREKKGVEPLNAPL